MQTKTHTVHPGPLPHFVLYGLLSGAWRALLCLFNSFIRLTRVNIKALCKWAKNYMKSVKKEGVLDVRVCIVCICTGQGKRYVIYGYLGYEAAHHRCCMYYIVGQLATSAVARVMFGSREYFLLC